MTRSRFSFGRAALAAAGLALFGLAPACAEDATVGDEQFDSEGPALAFDEYEVLFTNPICKRYAYGPDQHVVSASGETLEAKPENVWCTSSDAAASAARPESPQNKLVEWIGDPEVHDIFFAYFTMSNSAVATALCQAIEERDVKVTMVLDKGADLTRANQILACKPKSGDPERAPTLELRGGEGNISIQHDKLMFFDPRSEHPRLVFSSGNMSSGTVLHHENWHFIRLPATTFFAQAHVCLMDGLLGHASSKGEFGSFIKSCKQGITAKEERDAKVYFIPGEGDRASQALQKGLKNAESIDVAAHRFTYKALVSGIRTRLDQGTKVRLVVDDDLFWAGKGQVVGGNDANEAKTVDDLRSRGLDARFMETNHVAKLLHHNKFVVFHNPEGTADAAFVGSGNFTGSGFSDNLENFYLISVPHVVDALEEQYEHLYGDLATAPEHLPTELVVPEGG
jgi:hypothetical protein